MKFDVYSVKDVKKGAYLQPFFVPFFTKIEDVKLDFERNLKSAQSILNQFPEDFELCKIGSFMDELGTLTSCEVETICTVSDLLGKDEKKEDVGNSEVN